MNSFATERSLTAAQLAAFSLQLEQQRRFRVEQLGDYARAAAPTHAPVRPLSVVEREISDTILRGAREALTEIDAARNRLSVGTYGRCVDCGVRLPIERLEVLPHVARCLACHRAIAG